MHGCLAYVRERKTLRADEDRNEEKRQREEAVQTLAGPVQVDIVRETPLRRLEATTSDRGTSPDAGENSYASTREIGGRVASPLFVN
eukprot:COSAG05_NODE_398_length_10293_cov_11.919176_13_plen_87_part_00